MTWARRPGHGSYARPERERRLAEVEVDDLAAARQVPDWLGPEVTHDDRFSGGALAVLDGASAAGLLAEVRSRTA